jgi:hypothetical protein
MEDLMATELPTHHDIADRAYVLFRARGAADGFDLDDWLEAERELLDRRASADLTNGLGANDEDDEEATSTKRIILKKSYPRRAAG